jgi:hypothetical protein
LGLKLGIDGHSIVARNRVVGGSRMGRIATGDRRSKTPVELFW